MSAHSVVLPGFISEGELDELFGNATALLYLSLYEGFGLPLCEAIERGVPVIASDQTALLRYSTGPSDVSRSITLKRLSRPSWI